MHSLYMVIILFNMDLLSLHFLLILLKYQFFVFQFFVCSMFFVYFILSLMSSLKILYNICLTIVYVVTKCTLILFSLKTSCSNFIQTCSSIDNFLSSILISDCLIFCCHYFILHQKRNENHKNTIFLMKSKKKKKVPPKCI